MRHSLISLAAIVIVPWAGAMAQEPLPNDVALLYVAYQQAEQSGDLEAILASADAVYRAARRARVDDGTLGTLAENLGYYASAAQDFDRAYDSWRVAAENAERVDGAGAVSGYRWQNAAVAAFQLEDFGDARRCAMNASDGFHAEGELGAEAAATSAEAHLLAAQLSGTQGKFDDAGRAAERALALFQSDRRAPDRHLAIAFYQAGLSDLFDRDYFDAAVRLHLAADIFESVNPLELPGTGEGDTARTMARLAVRGAAQQIERRTNSSEFHEGARDVSLRILAEVDAHPFHQDIRGQLDHGASGLVLPEGATPPRALFRMEPSYPPGAAMRGQEGLVAVRFNIDEAGNVVDAEITGLFGPRQLGRASLDAVSRWSYEPATLDGEPIRVEGVEAQFNFELAN